MHPVIVLLVIAGLVLATTGIGVLASRRSGRVTAGHGDLEPGDRDELTLLQFSSEFCTPCRATARVLAEFAADPASHVRHVEVDIADRPDLVRAHRILQTPTTLLVDRDGAVRARIGGAVRRDAIAAELARLLEPTAVPA